MKRAQYKCIIVDDDLHFIEVLEEYISNVAKLELIGSFTDPLEAVKFIRKNDDIDFLFLDIKMEISGLEIAKIVRSQVGFLIFVTSHSTFALEAFGVGSDQYLVKPFDFHAFLRTINSVLKRNRQDAISVP